MDARLEASGYESWFVSARDPDSARAPWIRHTRHRPVHGPESAALWYTVAGVTLSLRRPGRPELTLSSRRGAYEFGARPPVPGVEPRPLPAG